MDSYPATQEYEKQIAELRAAEKKTSDAYLRIRELVNAFDTPHAPTPEQIYELTERKIKELQAENAGLRETMKDWVAFQKEHAVMYRENLELKAHVERLRTIPALLNVHKAQPPSMANIVQVIEILNETPAKSLAAHDAEVRKQERERCALLVQNYPIKGGISCAEPGTHIAQRDVELAKAIRNMPDVEEGVV